MSRIPRQLGIEPPQWPYHNCGTLGSTFCSCHVTRSSFQVTLLVSAVMIAVTAHAPITLAYGFASQVKR